MKQQKNHRLGCFGFGPPEPGFHKSKFKLGFPMMTCLILMTIAQLGVPQQQRRHGAHDARMMRA
jgi:hypothetical protein